MPAGTLAAATLINGRAAVDLTNGASPTATDGDNFANNGKVWLAVYNPEASSCNCTLDVTQTVDGQAAPDKVVEVPTLKTVLIGPFPTTVYGTTTKVTCALGGAGSLANVKLKAVKFEA
jgi:hypothetical protein